MGLNSLHFVIQFVVLMLVMSVLQFIRNRRWNNAISRLQIIILLVYSYFFVASVDYRFAICIGGVTLVAYIGGLLVDRYNQANSHSVARIVFVLLCIALLATLGYFKYTNFFIDSFNSILGLQIGTLNIVLPIGISFFTFSALSYLIDVYRASIKVEKNVINFALYMAFFPKITAGPIVRWSDFASQVKEYKGVTLEGLNDGIQIFVFGLFKKMVLADHLGVFVDNVFYAPSAYNTGTLVLSAISYSLQIYLDFSGYSDMAIGLAKMLGFDFKANFNLPYIARGFSDFWARWHISLSSWFKDYLYIPLGGSRKGTARTYINLMIVMLVSGLWHGAGWTFVIWGLLHGIASCITRAIKNYRKSRAIVVTKAVRVIEVVITYVFVTLFWTVFRADSISNMMDYLKALFTAHSGINQPYTWTFVSLFFVIVATVIAFVRNRKKPMDSNRVDGFYPILDLSKIWAMVLFFTFCGLTLLLGYYGNTAFIYGQF